uniref:G_PROTEIN_RECEP_F1_2 domain-containing protein n=1 Tax=Globodera pallida TaxID=36090 RepID=A0A183CN37_GLOPA
MTFFNDPVVLNGGKAYVAVLMILSNSILVFVTFKTKALNSTCNWLMAANSACIALYSLTYFVQFGIVLLRPSGIPLWQCCLLIPVPLFFLCCQYILFPLIALDRLIGTIFPLKQMGSRYKRRYIWALNISSAILYLALWARVKLLSSSVSRGMQNFGEI